MTDFLNALKTDLSDRRLLPVVALVGVALLAAIAYVVIGGSSSSSTPTAAVAPVTSSVPPSKLTVSQANTEKPVAETTEGTKAQHRGTARDPFVPLPVKTSKAAAAATPSTTGSPTTGSSPTTTTSKETAPSKPSTPSKPKTTYRVAVLFGVIPAGTDPLAATLTPYANLKLLTPLPSARLPLLVYRGVTTAGHSATFTVVGEAILRGSANCLPNAAQCAAINLRPGQSEQLEYLPPSGGPSVLYELRVVTIAASKAHAGSVKSPLAGISKAGREVLRRSGLVAIPYLHYSKRLGVLAFSSHSASAARARTARRHHHSR
ncbi:MAG TPA: hypothetical protein VFY36_04170 [Solirubrobacteraceae bacterium]|nr:hypothetical protein [Solirubrobacteraceae bacterium]